MIKLGNVSKETKSGVKIPIFAEPSGLLDHPL